MGLGISNFIAVESFKTSVKATIALFKVRDSVFLTCIVKFKEYRGFAAPGGTVIAGGRNILAIKALTSGGIDSIESLNTL